MCYVSGSVLTVGQDGLMTACYFLRPFFFSSPGGTAFSFS